MSDEQPQAPQLGLVGAMNKAMFGDQPTPMDRALADLDKRTGPGPRASTAVRVASAAVVVAACAAIMFLIVLGCIAMWHLVLG